MRACPSFGGKLVFYGLLAFGETRGITELLNPRVSVGIDDANSYPPVGSSRTS